MFKINRKLYLPAIVILAIATILILRHNNEVHGFKSFDGNIFGTTFHITYQGDTTLRDTCLAAMRAVDNSLSMFNPNSVLSAINNNSSLRVDSMTHHIIEMALKVSNATDGAFDITVAPLVNAWGFGFKNGDFPDSTRIDSILQHVGWKKLVLHDDHVEKLDTGLILDCSAIAKGYGCDAVAQALKRNGVKNFMVEIGGEIITNGRNPQNKLWRVGVSRPSETLSQQNIMQVLRMNNRAMATSGNYRNFYMHEGKKISHEIDPHTGFPVQHSLLSATVLAPSCALADAYATSFMVMGMEKSLEILEKDTTLSAFLVYLASDSTMQTWHSDCLENFIVK